MPLTKAARAATGMSRQGAPDRNTQKMPLRTRWSFTRGLVRQLGPDGGPFVVGEFVAHDFEARFGTPSIRKGPSRQMHSDFTSASLIGRSGSSASLIGRSGSSAFRLSTHYSVDVAHGLVLLYGIGTKAVPSWDSKTGWNNLSGGLVVSVTTGPSGSTISPHPSSREGHHSTARWSSSVLLLD